MRVLHLIPDFVFANVFHGAYKDVLFRTQWCEANVTNYRQIRIHQDEPDEIKDVLAELHPSHLLIEYTRFPKITRYLRMTLPNVWIGVRAHNIEPMQHLDNHGWWPQRGPLWMLYGMVRLWLQDLTAIRTADVILSINEWENRIYWHRLPGKARVEWLPYICPKHLLPADPEPFKNRKLIACLPTSQENRKSRDLVLRFQRFAQRMKLHGCDDEFIVTGDLRNWALPVCPEVTHAGFVDDLAELMGRCRAICMLSPLGFGFKTTIADALAAGAHVIAHPALVRRSPRILQPFMIRSDGKIDELLGLLQVKPQTEVLGSNQLQCAEMVMKNCFGEIR